MNSKGIQGRLPVKRRVHPLATLSILLSMLLLSLGDLMEIIPLFAPLVASSFFPFFHEVHDLMAAGLVIIATYKYRTSLGIAAIVVYLTLHIPYVVIQFPENTPELLRILSGSFGAIFGIWLIDRLRNTEARARTTLDNMVEGCQIIGFDWRYLYVNDSAVKQDQRTKKELLGHTMMEMYPGIEDTELFAVLRSCMETRSSSRMENLFTFPDGKQRWIDFSVEPEPEGVFMLSLDITERKQAEREINLLSTIITRVAGESQSFGEAIEFTLHEVCKSTEWSLGEAWLPSHDGKVLECGPFWCESSRLEEFRRISKELTFLPNQGLPGRVWTSQQSEWISDVSRQPERIFARAPAALKADLKAGVGIPVIANGLVVAVLVFFMLKVHEQDERLIRLVSSVVAQLGLVFQHKKAEETLRESEQMRHRVLDNIDEIVYVVEVGEDSMLSGRVLLVSGRVEKILGYQPEEFTRNRELWFSNIHPDDAPAVVESSRAIFASGQSGIRKYRMRDKLTGGYHWMEDHVVPQLDSAGGALVLFGVARDITERKMVEDALRIAEQNFRNSLDNSPLGIRIVTQDGELLYANKSILAIYGYSSVTELETTPAKERYTPLSYAEHQERKELRKQGKPVPSNYEISIVRKDGGIRHLSVSGKEVTWNGKIQFQAVYQDITEAKVLQEQIIAQDRLVSIGQLVSGVAHELNNPLTSVIGFSELLLQKELPDDVKADLKIVNDEAKRTSLIVKNLLSFARQQPQEKRAIDINEPIQTVLQIRSHGQSANNIKVNAHFATNLPQIIGNISQLQQVFFNIVTNAEQAMLEAHNKGTLIITTKQVDGIIRVSINDDGPGISPENMRKLFTPFFTTKGVGKGTGLGLSISHGIVVEHGGKMYAESKPGEGAVFIVELPIKQAEINQEMAK